MTFMIGDQVTWTSQAGGHTITKEGAVYEIVPAGQRPAAKIKQPGFPRDHTSYVVRGVRMTGSKGVQNYWPLVKNLRKKFNVFNEHALRSEIVRVWGPAGAHADLYDMICRKMEQGAEAYSEVSKQLGCLQPQVPEELRRLVASHRTLLQFQEALETNTGYPSLWPSEVKTYVKVLLSRILLGKGMGESTTLTVPHQTPPQT